MLCRQEEEFCSEIGNEQPIVPMLFLDEYSTVGRHCHPGTKSVLLTGSPSENKEGRD